MGLPKTVGSLQVDSLVSALDCRRSPPGSPDGILLDCWEESA